MEILIIVNLTAMLVALIFIAVEVRRVGDQVQQGTALLAEEVRRVAAMEEQTQKLILQTLSGMPRA